MPRTPKMYSLSFPPASDDRPSLVVSEYVALEPDAGGGDVVLRFASKAPVNFENLVYFCGGYLDTRTRRYFACEYRPDAFYPLFTLDSVMPADSPLSAEEMMKTIAMFSPRDENAFEAVWHNPFTASFVARQDCFPAFAATIDAVLSARMRLGKLRQALAPYADMRPSPADNLLNYAHFLEHLDQAGKLFKQFMLHWTVLSMQDVYSKGSAKKLAALFNFPLMEKAYGEPDYADREQLAELWEKQRDGDLEDDAFLAEDGED